MKKSDALRNTEYPFIAITLRSTLAWSSSIYGSNRSVSHLNCEQTNDLCNTELFQIEQFDDLILCKQMTYV